MPFSFRNQGSSVAAPMAGGPPLGLGAAAIVLASLAMACGSSGGSSGHGGAGGATGGGMAGSSVTGGAGTTGRAGATGLGGSGTGSSLPDLGKACDSDTNCTGGTTCLTASGKVLGGSEGPAHGYCSKTCKADSECGADGICLNVSADSTSKQGYCFQTCTFGSDPGTSKCHGRPDVGCLTLQDADPTMNLPQVDVCYPVCSQDSDCPAGRKCDVATAACGDVAAPGDPLGTHCTADPDGGTSNCAGGCLPIGSSSGMTVAAHYCSMFCVFGNVDGCNSAAAGASLASGGVHGVCALVAQNGTFGDMGFCTQECDALADCSDKTDTGGTCDTTYMSDIGHGICSW